MRKTEEGGVFVVKTTKFISEEDVEAIAKRQEHVKELRRKRRQKNDH